MRAVIVAGTRPNFVKVAPVLRALESRNVETTFVHTGQHYDTAMSDVFFEELGLRAPDAHLDAGSGSHAEQTAAVMTAFEPLLATATNLPDVVVVVGDVNSTLACALVAAKAKMPIPIAHVEAGLRSHDWSMPEEVNRVLTDRLARYLFAPSADAVENLRAEGEPEQEIHLVGNVMIDSLLSHFDTARERQVPQRLGLHDKTYGLVTLHRPALVDDPAALTPVLEALAALSGECPLVFPVHPRTRRHLAATAVTLPSTLQLTEPLGYLDFVGLEAAARVVLTDSGGVQEETTVLGIPCLTLRDNTERPITVTEGTNHVVGTDPARVLDTARRVLANEAPPPRAPDLWDGKAAERIADVLTYSLEVS